MNNMRRLAVISPFLDRSHGSERIISEWLSHLPASFEIHIYSQRVDDLDSLPFKWHRIPKLPGPHLFNFLWWLIANHLWINWDRYVRRIRYDLVFSSGTNCFGADAICVHVVFAEYVRRARTGMRLIQNPLSYWPYLIHRKLYYRLVNWLERHVYMDTKPTLVAYSKKTVGELRELYGRNDLIPVLYLGLDHFVFNPDRRHALRAAARKELRIGDGQFALLLVGNDWRNKGVPVLLDALKQLRELPLQLLVVSRESSSAALAAVRDRGLEDRVRFLAPRKDIEFYYAAADAYVGPSLQDSYSMPPAEAMACGLPVIVSASAGVSEIITHGVDGLILEDPRDAAGLAAMVRRLYEDAALRAQLGARAAETARQYTWERNGRELAAIFEEILRRKSSLAAQTLTQES